MHQSTLDSYNLNSPLTQVYNPKWINLQMKFIIRSISCKLSDFFLISFKQHHLHHFKLYALTFYIQKGYIKLSHSIVKTHGLTSVQKEKKYLVKVKFFLQF
jgi:hypothetical protein